MLLIRGDRHRGPCLFHDVCGAHGVCHDLCDDLYDGLFRVSNVDLDHIPCLICFRFKNLLHTMSWWSMFITYLYIFQFSSKYSQVILKSPLWCPFPWCPWCFSSTSLFLRFSRKNRLWPSCVPCSSRPLRRWSRSSVSLLSFSNIFMNWEKISLFSVRKRKYLALYTYLVQLLFRLVNLNTDLVNLILTNTYMSEGTAV